MSKNLSQKSGDSTFYILLIMTIGLVLFGWYNVYRQYVSLKEATIKATQAAELEIVRATSRAAQVYWQDQLTIGGLDPDSITSEQIQDIEQRFLVDYVRPIQLLVPEGNAWIIGSDNSMVFDDSPDFQQYFGMPISEFIAKQAAVPGGASNYDQMLSDVESRREGIGWYIWDQNKGCEWDGSYKIWIKQGNCRQVKEIGGYTWEKGIEIGAWTPAVVDEKNNIKWMIGLTTPLTAIMDQSGARKSVNQSILFMSVVTIVIAIVFYSFVLGQRRVRALQQEVAELKIEIDMAKKQQEVNRIVESEYFQAIKERAAEIRARAESHGRK